MSRAGGGSTCSFTYGWYDYWGKRSSYIILNSPYTWPQFLSDIVHFFVASKVAKYRAFRRALSLGNTLLWRFNLRYVAFRLSIAFVVLTRYRVSTTNIIEGVNRQFRKVTKTKSVFPNDTSLEKMLYLATQNVVEKWKMRYRNWDLVLSQLIILYDDRLKQYL